MGQEALNEFEEKYPDETQDFLDACYEGDFDFIPLIKYANSDYLDYFDPLNVQFNEFLHNLIWF